MNPESSLLDRSKAPCLVGMIHLAPLPGSPRSRLGFDECLERALRDAMTWSEGGADAILLENHGDTPFAPSAVEPHVVAFLAVAARVLGERCGLPVGLNCLRNDAMAALGAAAAVGGRFIRVNVLMGATATDQGIIQGEAHRLLRYRKNLGAEVLILADVAVKFGTPLYRPPLRDLVSGLLHRGGADGLIVTGTATGRPPTRQEISDILAICGSAPLILGSGVTAENAAELTAGCHGAIVGSSAKEGGDVDAAVDPARVAALRAALS